jgi:hypothetical protein
MKLTRDELTPALMRELVEYDPATGTLTWRERDSKWFTSANRVNCWNAKLGGKAALTAIGRSGYHHGGILGVNVLAHRVAWVVYYGEWPTGEVDHINGRKTDNRVSNLRIVDDLGNSRNAARRITNQSGVQGVYWSTRDKRWVATIRTGAGRRKHVGNFEHFEDAVLARKRAERQYGYHPNHGREQDASAA